MKMQMDFTAPSFSRQLAARRAPHELPAGQSAHRRIVGNVVHTLCGRNAPSDEAAEKYKDSGLEIVGVAVDEETAQRPLRPKQS
ncbi:hypothetical protein [Mesorhizobium sp. BHbdii]